RHFHRLDLDVAVGEVLEVLGELVDFLPLLADDHADAGGVDVNNHLLARPLDLDLRDAGSAVAFLDEIADLAILNQQLSEVLLVGVPVAQPIQHDAGAESGRPYFLPHELPRLRMRIADCGSKKTRPRPPQSPR